MEGCTICNSGRCSCYDSPIYDKLKEVEFKNCSKCYEKDKRIKEMEEAIGKWKQEYLYLLAKCLEDK